MSAGPVEADLVKESLLYKEFLAEREEILRHKWLESERAGHDIGFEKALLDWVVRHRADWRARRQKASSDRGAATGSVLVKSTSRVTGRGQSSLARRDSSAA